MKTSLTASETPGDTRRILISLTTSRVTAHGAYHSFIIRRYIVNDVLKTLRSVQHVTL